ncbi:hypothetical protein COL30_14035 [Bacillus pseudomycoides]|uniref:Sigma factor regulator C-terminal domain-containing protein n=1 Tax=Bacillus pseudomycoides TaxID=64104 RepID=A0A2B5HKS8_9BACI|nr:hypothetical protein CON79_29065 [Bacillus pseudomycoides]PEA80489.1 hypothetical protein CON99_28075 [Bacillus pseudomycoides]PED05826.1 hypothetical protein COO19_24355 [Bacillus pseudomycoides]PED71685.1 hypothetical protein CON97_12750 [Bacillus pseudomycoides]PEI35492.1 hypothetical protein CN620_25285 [Bacillus pseudomycoides]
MHDLFRYLLSLTGNFHSAEDLMQETFYRMLVHIDYYKGEEVLEMMRILSQYEETVKRVAQRSNGELNLQKQYQYVKKHGVKVYGIVITGPSKELVKFQNSPHVRNATLGDIEFWNWFERPSGSRH